MRRLRRTQWRWSRVYTRRDAIRDGRPMRFLSKGKMRTTSKA